MRNSKGKGYYWHKIKNKWEVRISLNGKSLYIGSFEKEEDAKENYIKAKLTYHNMAIE